MVNNNAATLPDWASAVLTADSLDRIEEAVREVEQRTSGEILPVLVRRSSVVGHVQLTLTFFLLAALVIPLLFSADKIDIAPGVLLLGAIFVSLIGAFLLAQVPAVQRRLITEADERYQVELRAEAEFFELKAGKTRARTGVLIFVSLFEKSAVVLADKAISDRLPKETWSEVVEILAHNFKHGHGEKGFLQAIAKVGQILAEHFPAQEGDVNELTDSLVLKE